MLFSIATPSNNERGPRYCERALSAIHQALRPGTEIEFEYGVQEGKVGLFVRVPRHIAAHVVEPIQANYPECSIVEVQDKPRLADATAWSAQLVLVPELFPILRHAQFEDMLNGKLADPISGILRAIRPALDVHCRLTIRITPASHKTCHRATRAVRLLNREFFRSHHRLVFREARDEGA